MHEDQRPHVRADKVGTLETGFESCLLAFFFGYIGARSPVFFIPLCCIEMADGRAFDEEMSTDFMGAFLINETAVKAFGWTNSEEALGKRLLTGHGEQTNPIIGVPRDFHYRGLQAAVEPLVMEYRSVSFSAFLRFWRCLLPV